MNFEELKKDRDEILRKYHSLQNRHKDAIEKIKELSSKNSKENVK